MIQLKQDSKGETLSGIVKDKLGNEVEFCSYYGRFDTVMALSESCEVVATIIIRDSDGFTLRWEDNKVRGQGLVEKLASLADDNRIPSEFVVNGTMFRSVYNKADALCMVGNNEVIASIVITMDGNVISLWRDANFRNSKTTDDYTLMSYGVALKKQWILKDSDYIYSWVAVDNMVSNKYVKNDGGHVFLEESKRDGVWHNVYMCSKEVRIEKARVLAEKYGVNFG